MTPEAQLILRGAVAVGAALFYGYVARFVAMRHTSPEARLANRAFAAWWGTIGAIELLAALYTVAAALGARNLALATATTTLILILVALAIGALLYYLVYLYTGNARWFRPIAISYAILAAGLVYLVAWMDPTGFNEAQGPAALQYAREPAGVPMIALGLAFSVPVILAAIAYGSLYFRTDQPEAKFRIAVIATSFGLWFGWSASSTILDLASKYPNSMTLFAVNSAFTLLAPAAILCAYRPPRWVRVRLERRELRRDLV